MRYARSSVSSLILVGVLAGWQVVSSASSSPTAQYCSYVLKIIQQSHDQVLTMVPAAEHSADRLIAGGNLYVAGSDQGFNLEAINRAGGMMATKLLPGFDQVKSSDIVLISFTSQNTEEDRALAARLSERGAMVIGFGSPLHAGRDAKVAYLFDNFAPKQDCVIRITSHKEPICPTAAIGNAINLWTFTAELVAACTRKGEMPIMWQSVMVEGSRERNQKYIGQIFHTDVKIASIGPGILGKRYLNHLAEAIRQIHDREMKKIQRAAKKIAQALNNGNAAYRYIIGHMPPPEVEGFGDPGLFRTLPQGKQLTDMENTVSSQDVVVGLVYTGLWSELLIFVSHTGSTAVWILASTNDSQKVIDRGDILIDQHWVLGDAIVEVPGYDVKILPPSAVTQLTIYWSLVGEMAKRIR